MATSSRSGGLFAAVCLLSSLSTASFSQAATLAEWTLTGKLNGQTSIAPDISTKSDGIANASLARAEGVASAAASNEGFGGNAPSAKGITDHYFVISFTVASGYSIIPNELSFSLYTGNSGPSPYHWTVKKNGNTIFTSSDVSFIATNSATPHNGTLDLSTLGTLAANDFVTLDFYATSNYKGRHISFFDSLSLTGTATETSGGDMPAEELAIAAISNKTATVGTPLSFAVSITIPEGMTINPGVLADKAVEGECSFDGTTFSYSPTKNDVDLSPITFTISATNDADSATFASESFAVTVSLPSSTLVTWNINANATVNPAFGVTFENPSPIANATLSLGSGVTAYAQANTFGGNNFDYTSDGTGTSFETAKTSGDYLQVDFTTASNFSIIPAVLAYGIRRTATGPQYAQWTVVASGNVISSLGDPIVYDKANDTTAANASLNLSSLGTIEKGESVSLRLYVWGATAGANGRFYFNTPSLVLSGYAEKDETVIIPPSVVAIRDQVVFVGETNRVAVTFSGDVQYAVATNCTAVTTGVSGTTWMEGATACFAPTDADADLVQPIELKVALDVSLDVDAQYDPSATYAVTVLRKPVLEIANGVTLREDFDTMGTGATAALPPAWSFAGTAQLWNNTSIYDNASGAITLAYDVSATNTAHAGGLGGNISSAGYWNFGAGIANEATDRAPGFYSTSNTSTGLRTASLIAPLKNVGTSPINSFKVSYSIEKYKSGHGKTVELRLSRDGHTWLPIPAESDFKKTTEDDKDGDTIVCVEYGSELPPPISVKGKIALDRPLAPGETLYLGWFCYATSSSTHSNVQALAIDDVRIWAGNPDTTVIMMK